MNPRRPLLTLSKLYYRVFMMKNYKKFEYFHGEVSRRYDFCLSHYHKESVDGHKV